MSAVQGRAHIKDYACGPNPRARQNLAAVPMWRLHRRLNRTTKTHDAVRLAGPLGAPLPSAPPCIRHLRRPMTGADLQGAPDRVRAPQWLGWEGGQYRGVT